MTRGSDIEYTLVLKEIELDQIVEAYVTVEQNRGSRTGDDIEVTKEGSVFYEQDGTPVEDPNNEISFDYENNAIKFVLEQKETLMFESGVAEVQLRLRTIYGNLITTTANTIRVNPVLYTKVL